MTGTAEWQRELALAPQIEAGESQEHEQQQEEASKDRCHRQRTFCPAVGSVASVEGYVWVHVGNAVDLAYD